MHDVTLTLLVLGGTVVLFVANRLPVAVVALLSALALWIVGLSGPAEIVAGFGDPIVIFIASLFVVAEGIDATGVTAWLGQQVMARFGGRRGNLLLAICVLGAVLSSLITLNGAVAALTPLVVMLATRIGEKPSRFLMPLSFAGGAGALLMLPGSPVNVIVSEAAAKAGEGPFAIFSFAVVGIPVLVGTIAIALLFGERLLPDRSPAEQPPDLARYAATIAEQYAEQGGFYRLRVRENSPLLGVPPMEIDASPFPGIEIIGAQSPGSAAAITRPLQIDDVLIVSGPRQEVTQLAIDEQLAVYLTGPRGQDELVNREAGVAEVMVRPRSSIVGSTVFPGMRRAYDLVILAVQRNGRSRDEVRTRMQPGDLLLVHGSWDALDRLTRDRDVLVVDSPDVVRRQTIAWGFGAWRAVGCLAVMIGLLAFGVVPPHIAGLIAALLMVITRVVSVDNAFRAISWDTIVLIGALIPLTEVIQSSGAADRIAAVLIDAVGNAGPRVLIIGVFALTAILGQMISNTATTLVVTPIAVSAAVSSGVSVLPVLMAVAVAGSAALLTPIATPGNMMIMGPGGYRFGDYWKLGLPTMVWWLICTVVIVPLVWPF
ncbi:SLC13 family permease [Microlunatus sp. Gsoil 973]|uniref:SLC13 family permease n=1 Tax=Microlunatus sp. Gsoil 973 TaxID=2672569 RepID=UPI0012B4A6F8|nr:SLC13 family permease [Microlunatus sp. Gsoil 973]QGN34987.1 SLC13 family permease [Microlunatus sp. Gsoil 973]